MINKFKVDYKDPLEAIFVVFQDGTEQLPRLVMVSNQSGRW